MNIGIMADVLGEKYNRAGIGNYLHETLKEMCSIETDNAFYLFSNSKLVLDFDLPSNWKIIIEPSGNRLAWQYFSTSKLVKKYNIDVFWAPTHVLPLFKHHGVRYIMTVHDVANYKLKSLNKDPLIKPILKYIFKKSLKKADTIIAVSKATKNDLIELFDIDSQKVTVIYEGGANSSVRKIDEYLIEEIKSKYSIGRDYYLYVGTLQPRKNIETIYRGYVEYRNCYKGDKLLVLAGGIGWGMEELLSEIDGSKIKDDIIMTGYITENDKWGLYSGCSAFLFPSLYEGFGIPVLEAMRFGLPVITSRVSSLEEVGGNVALYINDVKDYKELGNLLYRIDCMSKDELNNLRQKCYQWQKEFTWRKCAIGVFDALNSRQKGDEKS